MKVKGIFSVLPVLAALQAAAVDGFTPDGMPFAEKGFGVRRNFYQSGRISAKVSDIAGLFELDYIGTQPYDRPVMYSSPAENGHWMHGFAPYVLVDGEPYRLTFANTVHYPFGYRSECTVAGVRLRHEFVLDRNAAFRRITVLSNPDGKSVRCRIVLMQAGMRGGARWRRTSGGLAAEATFDGGARVGMSIGSMNPVAFPLNDRPPRPLAYRTGDGRPSFRFNMDETAHSDRHLFWWVFDAKDDEDLSEARVERVFDTFNARRADDVRFETGDAFVDGWLGYAVPMSSAFEVDGRGAFRASPTYWVWGWDAMVHAGTLALCGRAAEVRRMLAFFRDTASEEAGILHSYGTTFAFEGAGSDRPGQSLVMPPAVQLFWVVLLDEYVCATGDDAFKAECLPFARKLVARAKASADPSDGLPHRYGYFPDNPYAVDQRTDDIALINCAVYWQGLAAWHALTGEGAADVAKAGASVAARLWDAPAGWWCDSWDVSASVRRPHRPLYGFFHVSRFAPAIASYVRFYSPGKTADFLRREFFMGDRLVMFGRHSDAWCADGNQLGAYYPVTDRTYWNAMNAAKRTDALDDFRHIVGRHARVLTYPEGQTADVMNGDPSDYPDELGNKQFFAAKGWLSDALDLWLGMRVSDNGVSFSPMNDGKPFAVRGMSLRGKKLDVVLRGAGSSAAYTLNGTPLEKGFVPWSSLVREKNTLLVTLSEKLVLENAALRAEVDPSNGGRLVFLGRRGGKNVLWTDPAAVTNSVDAKGRPVWKNTGGEKTWVGSMARWPGFRGDGKSWPPPAWFDEEALEVVRRGPTNILLRSAEHVSGDWRVSLEREFTLADGRLLVRQALRSPGAAPAVTDDTRRIWSVVQIPHVDGILARRTGERRTLYRCRCPAFSDEEDSWSRLDFSSAPKNARVIFDGDAFSADIPDAGRLVIRQSAEKRHLGLFAEPGRAIVFSTGKNVPKPYIELEFAALGPDAAQTLEFRVEESERIRRMREDTLGMFIHWGLYSVPARKAAEWVMNKESIPAAVYNRYADAFNPPASFSPREWVRLAKRAGCRYAVLTTRHHDGFCLFDTKTTDFNSVKTAAKRDFVRAFADACRAEGLRVGFYYSIMNWQYDHSPGGVFDRKVWDAQVKTTHAALRELMTNYGKVDYLWYDGCVAPGSTDAENMERLWRISELNAMVRSLQPDILINDRSSSPGDYSTPEQCLVPPPRGRAWESCITCNGSWGYAKDDRDWKSAETLVRSLLQCVRFGGNLLINVGPRADGSVPDACRRAFEGLGDYIAKCPGSIYGSSRDEWTETTHEGGVVTKAGGAYWLHTFGGEPRLGGAARLEKAAGGIYKVTLDDAAVPRRWLGGRHDVAIKAGGAPVLGEASDRFEPPVGKVVPSSAEKPAFDLPAGGLWRLEVGFTGADGFKDTYVTEHRADGVGKVPVAVSGAKDVYATRLSPVWKAVDPKSWRVAGKFKSRFYETGFDAREAESVFAKDLYAEASGASFVAVGAENDKGDRSDVRLNHNYTDPKAGIGYSFARRNFRSDRDRTVYAAFGVDWWGRVYVNGRLALETVSGWKPKPFLLKLEKGDNDVLVVTHGGSRAHWFVFYVNGEF